MSAVDVTKAFKLSPDNWYIDTVPTGNPESLNLENRILDLFQRSYYSAINKELLINDARELGVLGKVIHDEAVIAKSHLWLGLLLSGRDRDLKIQHCEIAARYYQNSRHAVNEVRALLTLGHACNIPERVSYGQDVFQRALNICNEHRLDVQRAGILSGLAMLKSNIGEQDLSLNLSEQALEILLNTNHAFERATVRFQSANIHRVEDRLETAESLVEDALIEFADLGNLMGTAQALCLKGFLQLCSYGSPEIALSHLTSGCKIFTCIGQDNLARQEYFSIGNCQVQLGDFTSALQYFVLYDEYAIEIKNSAARIQAQSEIGRLFIEVGDHENAIKHLEIALNLCRENSMRSDITVFLNIMLASAYGASGNHSLKAEMQREALATLHSECKSDSLLMSDVLMHLGEALLEMSEPEEALRCFTQSIYIVREVNHVLLNLPYLLIQSAKAQFKLNRLGEARTTAEEGLMIADEIGDYTEQHDAHQLLALVYLRSRQFDQAHTHITQTAKLKRRLCSISNGQHIGFTTPDRSSSRRSVKLSTRITQKLFRRGKLENWIQAHVKQHDFYMQCCNDLVELVGVEPTNDPVIDKLRVTLEKLCAEVVDWRMFESEFSDVHPMFVSELLSRSTLLSPCEHRICSLLRLDIKAHEIARLTNTSEREVESIIMAIRMKLDLDPEQSLTAVLSSL